MRKELRKFRKRSKDHLFEPTDESTPLFRQEAVDVFARRSYGKPVAKMPSSWHYFTVLLVLMVSASAFFLTTSTYARKESVVGSLTPKGGLIRIAVSESGILESVTVKQGDNVEQGDILFVLSSDRKGLAGVGASEEIAKKLDEEMEELQSQIKIETAASKLAVETAVLLTNQLQVEKNQTASQIQIQEERVEIQGEILERFQVLESKDAVSFLEIQTQRERHSSQKQALATLLQRSTRLERDLINARNVMKNRPLESRRIKSELQQRLIEITNRKTQTKAVGRQVVDSPIAGSVATLEVKAGNVVYPRQLLATILPADSELFAEIYIPSRAIGFVKPKQSVRVMYEAFPHQRFGAASGEVFAVSNSILSPEEIPTNVGLKEPAYKAVVRLKSQYMEGFGQKLSLKPGMALQAEIILERRTFLEWFLEPLRAKKSKA